MAWNQAQFERGVRDALDVAAKTSIVDLIFQYTKVTSTGEYEVGWRRGVRRVLIDKGERTRCADFVLMSEARTPVWKFVRSLVDSGRAAWRVDPEHRDAVGLVADGWPEHGEALLVIYLEDGDFEESLRLLEMMDDAGV